MPVQAWSRAVVVLVASVASLVVAQASEETAVDFRREILPILATNCFACHGPDAHERQADLRLDQEQAATETAIVPGDATASELLKRITSGDDDLRMPPPETGRQLTAAEIERVRRWIDQGAPWATHWAFEPPIKPDLPEVNGTAALDGADGDGSAIDRFVRTRLAEEGLEPSPPASRRAWLRRVSFDLTGLPPTPEELAAFEADASADAFATQVDRLLASPRYGERMAAGWLDIARYADTNGYQNDFNRSMWPWRDWVINAFNANMPGDTFLLDQLAGDLLPDPTQEQLIATGFNRNHRMVTEGGSIDEEWRVENVVDRVETTSTAFLGLTMGCARCHDHKYDDLSQREFYRFYAFFNNVDEQGVYTERRGNVPPMIDVPTPEQQQQLADLDHELAMARERLAAVQVDLAAFFASEPAQEEGTMPVLRAVAPVLRAVANGQLLAAEPAADDSAPDAARDDPARMPAGEPTWVEGPSATGVALAGNEASHVDLGQRFAVHPEQPASWTLWARVAKPGALLSRMDDGAAYRGFDTILLEDMRLKVHLISAWPADAIAVTSTLPVPKDAWFHLAVSYDGSRKAEGVKLWLDGVPLETNLEQNSLQGDTDTAEPLRLGRRSSGLFLSGSLADVKFFEVPLDDRLVETLRKRDLRQQVASLTVDTASLPEATATYLRSSFSQEAQQAVEQLQKQRGQAAGSVQTTMVMRDRDEYRPTHLLRRGQYDQPEMSEELWPEIPALFGSLDDLPKNRLGLATWLVQPEQPLVPRVMVNRLWQQMFGVGLVATSDNFGVQGEPPTHPALLDWLAVRFVESGWDIKAVLKEIALSKTYRQSAACSEDLQQCDPDNRLLARGPRRRLSAEMVRDNALAVSGLLHERLGGPPVKPYQPAGLWDDLAGGANGGPYVVAEGDDLYRRSLYTFRKRTVSHPTLSTFDAPSWELCQAKRGTTNTPLQALALLNDTTYAEAAAHLAVRMQAAAAGATEQGVQAGFLWATSREPTAEECQALLASYDHYLGYYRAHPTDAEAVLGHGGSPIPADQRSAELAAYAAVATVILNLDETISH